MIEIHWAADSELAEVAAFLSRVISIDDDYVSHGEVQTGLSKDGRHWAPDLDRLMAEDLADLGSDRSVVVALSHERIVGAAILLWVDAERVRYVVIEDLAVDPEMRSAGLGAKLVAFAEDEARARGMAWAFLESGLGNESAHHFFERHGFRPLSKTFAKPLG